MIQLICGFAGIGKSHLVDGVRYIDFDSSAIKTSRSTPLFAVEYIQALKDYMSTMSDSVMYIFLSTHVEVRNELNRNNLEYTIVFPDYHLKDVYLRRYKDRGSSDGFVKLFENSFTDFVESCYNDPSKKIVLTNATQYLSDVI